jgi:hypothetical protein
VGWLERNGGIIEALPVWERDRAAICSVIASHKVPFRIILKTKDEPRRLACWIEHHAGIVGVENLIIFDNMSSDLEVLRIYEQFYGKFPIIRYGGFQDMLHQRRVNDKLYQALARSCTYSTLIDTDEFLSLYDGERFLVDSRIVDFVMSSPGTPVLPGTWLDNAPGHNDRFLLSSPAAALRRGLKWGKPVVSTGIETPDIVLHNTQLQDTIKSTRLVANIFILHRKQVVPQERIRVNLQKLRALNVIPRDLSLEQVLALDVSSFTLGRAILSDIHALAGLDGALPPVDGSFQIDDQGVARWQTPEQAQVFHDFIRDPLLYADQLFAPWRGGG